MLNITATAGWRSAHPGAIIGLLEISGVNNNRSSDPLNNLKRETEARLRQQYAGFTRQDFTALPVMKAYERYYKRFNKTYHVLQQTESIVLKGKNLPDVSPLVDANFIAEVSTLVLTAGHDTAQLHGKIMFDTAGIDETMIQMNGSVKTIPAGDMVMRDANNLCCSILYGQDNRSPITPQTSAVLYVAYAPQDVPAEAVEEQLQRIQAHVRLFAPLVTREQCRLIRA